jgi:hypothetical protein
MEQNLGVAVEDSTSVMQNFMGIGKMSADVANKTAGAAASLAKAAGVPFAKVMKDVATAGGEVLKLVRGSVDALVKGAVEASKGFRLLQTGMVGFYIFMMVAGILALLFYSMYKI